MNAGTTYLGFEEWLPRRSANLLAVGLWVAGFAMAGAAAARMHHTATNAADVRSMSFAIGAPAEPSTDLAAARGALVMPEDVLVAHVGQR